MSTQRLQKILAQAGVASRRAAEQLIVDGRVRVNGRIVRELGTRANLARDRVEVNGRRLVAERPVYYLLHKPRGVVTTLDDPEGRKTVKDLLHGVPERVFPVGRLDFHTSGVLLLTNDGALAQALLHPKRAVPKTYNAKLQGQLDQAQLDHLRAGVVLDDGEKTAPAEVCLVRSDGKHTALEITIAEGKNRQIHRMGEAIGCPVLRLTRVSFAGLTLERLQVGQKRTLTPKELAELKQRYLHADERPRRLGAPFFAETAETADVEVAHPTRPRRPKRDVRRRGDLGERTDRAAVGARRGERTGDDARRNAGRVQHGRDASRDAPRGGFGREIVNAADAPRRVSSNPYSKPRGGLNTENSYSKPRRGVNPKADPRRRPPFTQPLRSVNAGDDVRRAGANAYGSPRRSVNGSGESRRGDRTTATPTRRVGPVADPRRKPNRAQPKRGRNAGSEALQTASPQRGGRKHVK